jgi:hypothetical protein
MPEPTNDGASGTNGLGSPDHGYRTTTLLAAADAGATDFVTKSLNATAILVRVRSLLDCRALSIRLAHHPVALGSRPRSEGWWCGIVDRRSTGEPPGKDQQRQARLGTEVCRHPSCAVDPV